MILRIATETEFEALGREADLVIPITSRADPDEAADNASFLTELGYESDAPSDVLPWFDLKNVATGLEDLIDGEERVLPDLTAHLLLHYPLEQPCVRPIQATSPEGFSRADMLRLIAGTYLEIYRQEADSQSVPTPAPAEREGLINRPGSDGTFGIWGHDIEDLGVEGIEVHRIGGTVWLKLHMVS